MIKTEAKYYLLNKFRLTKEIPVKTEISFISILRIILIFFLKP
ncbi:hypothetical protein DES36_102125 [Alkalibaculum bacchi]|uniref:Uncharacterized protein n=1 Tax=Alkalibaculum bacchi TaxID=645887 RepID=A0A366IDB8_9FIRM|nr:hypothetical protein DES36_102125 [Alkalibaculum bacchi]